ncbi:MULTISPECIES: AbiJ-NTD4 domain-containing protein [Pseudomonas fluorescens group]|nr:MULTISPECIES: hypothetical protein [Pseudomonas fluorescens group]NMZ19918.1 hypothetical protein [Pseudomonas rhodesiae]
MPDDQTHLSFSQRMGLVPAVKAAQVDSIDVPLKNALWNVVLLHSLSGFYSREARYPDRIKTSYFYDFAVALYSDFFKVPVDTLPSGWSTFKERIRESYFKMSWHRTYSFLEFLVALNHREKGEELTQCFNTALVRENSAYRFVSGKVTPITSTEEIEEIEQAISASDQYAGVRTHLNTALGLLTDRKNPDYRNSMKESISAVEALAKHLTGNPKATLGEALTELERRHRLDPVIKKAFSTLYGYTNNSDGIRHAVMEDKQVLTKADARFMLICCSAFINLTIDSVED